MTTSPGATPVVMGRELDALIAEKVMGWQQFPYLTCHAADSGIVQQWGATTVTIHHCPPGRIHVSTIERVPAYSTDIAAAWLVVVAMHHRGFHARITSPFTPTADYFAGFTPHGTTGWNGRPDHEAHAQAAPLAICRAALLAVGAA